MRNILDVKIVNPVTRYQSSANPGLLGTFTVFFSEMCRQSSEVDARSLPLDNTRPKESASGLLW